MKYRNVIVGVSTLVLSIVLGVVAAECVRLSEIVPFDEVGTPEPIAPKVTDAEPSLSPVLDDGEHPIPTQATSTREEPPSAEVGPAGIAHGDVASPVCTSSPRMDELLQLFSEARTRNAYLESALLRVQAQLDECQMGSDSPLGNARALPEWPTMTQHQQSQVIVFLESFPVLLRAGEAQMIGEYASPTGEWARDLVHMLGAQRVLVAIGPERAQALREADPDEFEALFGTVK